MQNIEDMSFEQAIKELEVITKKLEDDQISIDESIKLFEKGCKIKVHCEKILKQAELKVDKIVEDDKGNFTTEALDNNQDEL